MRSDCDPDRIGATPCTTVFPQGTVPCSVNIGHLEQHNLPASTAGSLCFFTMANIKKLRKSAFLKQNGCCFYCGHPIWESGQVSLFAQSYPLPPRLLELCQSTAEHLRARQDGGKDCRNNIAAACKHCNASRHLGRTGQAPSPNKYKSQIRAQIKQWHPAWFVLNKAKQWGVIGTTPTLCTDELPNIR